MRIKASIAAAFGMAFLLQGNPASAAGSALCSWTETGAANHEGKHVLLTLYRSVGKIGPIERFENGKVPIGGIQKTPVSGIGDDAYYIDTPGFGMGLNVKRRNSAFQVKVFGFSAEFTKTLERALAETVLAKL